MLRVTHHRSLLTLMLGLILLAGPFHHVYAENPMDAVVIMDSSGSMKKTDPKELRKPAAKLFITLMDKDDRLSVMSFSDNAYPITFLSRLNSEKNRSKALQATERVSSKGIYTNLYAAINKGLEFLRDSHSNQHKPILLLMSDGKMDVGDKEKSAELKQKIFSELLPELKKHQIRIYSIAFTTESDQGLLQEIADATDGRYALAASDDVLHKVFTKMFEQSKEPNMLPLTENQFVVDKSISEITIIANKKDDASQIFLETPTGKRINSSFKSKALKWFVSPGFDMITLSKPEEGTWKILFSDDDNKAYIVANIKLRSQFKYDAGISNEATIETWFIKDDKPVINNELLNTLELNLEIENPEGQVEQLTLEQQADSGIFKAKFTPSMNGIYAATVMAKSKTFQRQQYFSFRAAIPEKPAIESEPEPAIEELPAATEPETAEPVAEEQPVIEQEETAEEDNLLNDILLFIIINVVIVFVGVNIYFISNILKARTPKDRKEAKE